MPIDESSVLPSTINTAVVFPGAANGKGVANRPVYSVPMNDGSTALEVTQFYNGAPVSSSNPLPVSSSGGTTGSSVTLGDGATPANLASVGTATFTGTNALFVQGLNSGNPLRSILVANAGVNIGTVGLTQSGNAVSATNPLPAVLPSIGIGVLTAVPTTGTSSAPVAIGTLPATSIGVTLYLPANSSVTGFFGTSNAATSTVWTWSNALYGAEAQININVAGGFNLYLTAVTGSVLFRAM